MKWSELSLKERKQIYDSVRANNPDATYFDIKEQYDSIPTYEDGKDDVIATYGLPEVNVYPQNRFGDIARSQGIETARNWKAVREGTTKGINDFANDPRTQFVLATTPLPGGFEGTETAMNMISKAASKASNIIKKNVKSFLSKATTKTKNLKIDQIQDLSKLSDSEWDYLYNTALESKDFDELQKIRDLHFKTKAPNTKIINKDGNPLEVYHGTNSEFNSFDSSKWKYGAVGEGNYFGNGASVFKHKPITKKVYLNQENPLIINDDMREKLFEDVTTKPIDIIKKGNDGVLVNYSPENLKDFETVIYNPSKIKSASSITYDNAGNIIPISKRDNFNINDLRYGLIPLGLGTTYEYLNNDGSNSIPAYEDGVMLHNTDEGFVNWKNNLAPNLKNEAYGYDLYGAYKSGAQPILANDGDYHLQSRDPESGRLLKYPSHSTFWKAIAEDAKLGYYPVVKGKNTYTIKPGETLINKK